MTFRLHLMDTQQLRNIGLSEDQIKLYELLLQYGSVQAGRLSILSGLKRPQVYKVLQQLIDLDLVEKDVGSKIARFSPGHPAKLRNLLDKKITNLNKVCSIFDSTVDELISKYNLISGKPNVQFFEGKRGLKKVYDDILVTHEDIFVFRSSYDNNYKEIRKMISEQIEKQVRKNISTKAITPAISQNTGRFNVPGHDTDRLVQRRVLSKKEFNIPAQIIIYGHKVGITSFRKGIFTTIIDNNDIAESFEKIFDHLWDKSSDPK
jgi:sugar-specific transcriptional regulator TrmB